LLNGAAFIIIIPMEITDEKLRQIVRETLRELGPEANPALVRKVVRDVVRHLLNNRLSARPSLNLIPNPTSNEPKESEVIRVTEGKNRRPSQQEY
jgi:hypothetical protein